MAVLAVLEGLVHVGVLGGHEGLDQSAKRKTSLGYLETAFFFREKAFGLGKNRSVNLIVTTPSFQNRRFLWPCL